MNSKRRQRTRFNTTLRTFTSIKSKDRDKIKDIIFLLSYQSAKAQLKGLNHRFALVPPIQSNACN